MPGRLLALALGVLGAALALGALELASRALAPTPLPQPVIADEREDWAPTRRFDPLLFWSLRPGVEVDGEPFTNALGLRWPEVPPKTPDEFRILSLGESTTFGMRLAAHETYSARLEARLPEVDGRRVRVVNAGVPGYSLFQGQLYLRRRGAALEPDAVLVYFGFNDFLPVAYRAQRHAAADGASAALTDRELHERQQRTLFRAAAWLLQHSNLYRAVALREAGARPPPTRTASRPRVPEADRRDALEAMHAFCEARGIRLVVVVPWYRRFEEHGALLRRFGEETGVPVVDLPARLAGLPQPRRRYFSDKVHPTAEGHAHIARELAEALRRAWPDAR